MFKNQMSGRRLRGKTRNQTRVQFVSGLIILLLLSLLSPIASWAADGDMKWMFDAGYAMYSSPAIGADGTVYVGSYDGSLYAINPDGTQKWAFTTYVWVWRSSPAIGVDGTVYAGCSDGGFYAIEGSSGGLADTPWPMFHHDLKHTGRVEPCPFTVVSSERDVLDELRQFRDGLLTENETGQSLTHLYYHHSPEVAGILLENPVLSIRSAVILKQVMPGIHFLLGDRTGRDIVMNRLLVHRIQTLFADIGAHGSDELADTLSMLSNMLDGHKGMRFSRIWQSVEKKGSMRK